MTSVPRRDLMKPVAAAAALMAGLNFVAGEAAADEAKTGAGAASIPIERFDFVIAGAGHNSLTCGAYLAKAGYRVLILEGHQVIGGGLQNPGDPTSRLQRGPLFELPHGHPQKSPRHQQRARSRSVRL